MQPQNPNQNDNSYPTQPQQPGQSNPPVFRRPVQPIAPRPFAAPQAPTPQHQQPSQAQASQSNAPQPVSPAQSNPQARPLAPQAPRPSTGEFVSAPKPAQPQPQSQQFTQPQFRQNPRSTPPPETNTAFNTVRPTQHHTQPIQLDQPLDLNLDHDAFPRPEKSQPLAANSGTPKGVFVLVAVGLATLAVGLIDKSQHNMVFNVAVAADLLLAIGLLIRKELLRKAAVGFAIATVTISAALVLSYRGLTDSTVNAEELFITEAKKLQNQSPTKQLTHEQQQHLDAMQLKLEAQQNALGENSTLVYGKYGATVALYALAALYLTRPKVKEAFVTSSKIK